MSSVPKSFVDAAPLEASVEQILSAVVFGAQNFMKTQNWSGFLESWLQRLGEATGSSQVRIFANDGSEPDGTLRSSMCAQWLAPGVPGSPAEMLQSVSYCEAGCERWVSLLSNGEFVVGVTHEMPASEQPILASQGCVSVALVPVFVDGQWWGFIGFADCMRQRTWTSAALDALSAAAGIYGAALSRGALEERIAAAAVQEQLASEVGEVVTTGAASLDDTLMHCSARIAHRLNVDLVRIWTTSPDGAVLRSRSGAFALGDPLLPSEMSTGECAVGRIAQHKTSEVWQVELPEIWPGSTNILAAAGLEAGAGHPLLTDGAVVGVVVILSRTMPPQRVLDALASVTDELALAIERSHAVALRDQTEDRYRRLVEATTEGIVIHDGVRVIDVNPSLAAMVGYSVQDIIGRNPFEFIHPDSIPDVKQRLVVNYTRPYEAVMVRRDGSTFPIEFKGRDFMQDGVKLRVTTIRDLTERKQAEHTARELQAERAARELSERTRAHAEFLADASRILASSFDTTTTLNQLAHLSVRFLGDCCLVSLFSDDGTEDAAHVQAAGHDADPDGESMAAWTSHLPASHALRARLRSGEAFVMNAEDADAAWDTERKELLAALGTRAFMCVPIVSGGDVLGTITFSGGRTRTAYGPEELAVAAELGRRAAVALQSAQSYHDAHAATAARDEMLAVVAHDLRNPLNTIHMGSSLALELTADDPAAPGRRQMEIVVRTAEHMNRLIQDLLDATRLQSGQLALELVPTPPSAIVQETLEMLLPLAANAKISLDAELADELTSVYVDRLRIQQVLSNLIGNALKFTQAGGRIGLRVEPCDAAICFHVADTGQGIAEDQLPHVFGRFWQARSTDRRGLGLGLAIARGIIEAHGGSMRVESRVGVGTTFSFTVPRAPMN